MASLARRQSLSGEARIAASLAIAEHGHRHLSGHCAGRIVSGFFPIRGEPDMRPLMALLKDEGARLCLPVVVDAVTIVFRELLAGARLVDAGFGTCGPGPEAALVDPDIMLVPLAAFDRHGHRIGYGAGHYDRAITRLRAGGAAPHLIGVAFDTQEVDAVPYEPHDVRLDAVLTESGVVDTGAFGMPQRA